MPDLTLKIQTSARQHAKLARVLAGVNQQRAEQGLSTFSSIEEFLQFSLLENIRAWVERQTNADALAIGQRYETADDSVRAVVDQALGI